MKPSYNSTMKRGMFLVPLAMGNSEYVVNSKDMKWN